MSERPDTVARGLRRGFESMARPLVPITALAALPVYAVALRRHARWKGRSYP